VSQPQTKRRISPERAKARAAVAGLGYAVQAGKRRADDPQVRDAHRELAVVTLVEDADRLAARAQKLVAAWPDLTPEQLDRVAGILRAAAPPVRRGGAVDA